MESDEMYKSEIENVCGICSEIFETSFLLQRHFKQHRRTDTSSLKASGQSERSKTSNKGSAETLIHTIENACSICSQIFDTPYLLERHIEQHQRPDRFVCSVCGKKFVRQGQLDDHSVVHTKERPYECHVCSRAFSYRNTLKLHILGHEDVKPFKCHICQKGFVIKQRLETHLKTHSEQPRPFICNICKKGYLSKRDLVNHFVVHSSERPYACDICNKTYARPYDLKKHLIIHLNERKFECEICHKRFNHRGALTDHTKTHSGLKPYKCITCNKAFTAKDVLKRHSLLHMTVKPFVCSICEKGYVAQYALDRHVKTHYKRKPIRKVPNTNDKEVESSICKDKNKNEAGLNSHAESTSKLQSKEESMDRPLEKRSCRKKDSPARNIVIWSPFTRNKKFESEDKLNSLAKKHNKRTQESAIQSTSEVEVKEESSDDGPSLKRKSRRKKNKPARYIDTSFFLTCNICNQEFGSQDELNLHVKVHHKQTQDFAIQSSNDIEVKDEPQDVPSSEEKLHLKKRKLADNIFIWSSAVDDENWALP